MCSATNTRLRSVAACAASIAFTTGANASPSNRSSSGAFSSVFHDTTVACVCSASKVASMRASRSAQRARVAATIARASSKRWSTRSRGGRTSSSGPQRCSASGRANRLASASASLSLLPIDSSMLMRSMPSL